jgi:predicted regulator of Ras-like GTPase activity (Roadblock/LC7/MglB family)
MPTIRDLVIALRHRDGVEAVVVLGHDGLLIDGSVNADLDAEALAALVPPIAGAAADLAQTLARGPFGLSVLEYERGMAVVAAVSAQAFLLVLVRPDANLSQLLFDLRRHRLQIAALL